MPIYQILIDLSKSDMESSSDIPCEVYERRKSLIPAELYRAMKNISQHCIGRPKPRSSGLCMIKTHHYYFYYTLFFNKRLYGMSYDIYTYKNGSWDIYLHSKYMSNFYPLKERRMVLDLELNRVRELIRTPLNKILSEEIFV